MFIRVLLVVSVGVGVVVVAVIVGQLFGSNPFERLFGLLGDESVGYRQQAIAGALGQFSERPLFGDALLERSTFDYPHNIFVESLMSVGIVGTTGLLAVTGAAVGASVQLLRRSHEGQWIGMLCLIQIFAATTSGALYLSDSFWALSAAAIAARSNKGVVVSLLSPRAAA